MPYKKSDYKIYNANKLTAADFNRLIPRKLYKYRTCNEFFFKSLENNSLWFSNPADFNDPFDCRLNISLGNKSREIIKNLRSSKMLIPYEKKEYRSAYKKMINDPNFFNEFMSKLLDVYNNEKISVCCMAENPYNILMWSHYAASHSGVCLEFNIDRSGFMYQNLLPVQYKYKYPKFNLSNYGNEKRNFYTMHQQSVCTKSILWEYEREWRIVLDKERGSYPFDKKDLTKVIFGIHTPKKTITEVMKILKAGDYFKTKIYKCEMKENSFSITMRVQDSE